MKQIKGPFKNINSLPGSVRDARDKQTKDSKVPFSHGAYVLVREINNGSEK